MLDIHQLKKCLSEYMDLYGLRGGTITPSKRGQEFNKLFCDLLKAYRINAECIIAGIKNDEVDIAFELNKDQYVGELKWVAGKINYVPIAVLQAALGERLHGVKGIFISMTGYTRSAVQKAEKYSILLMSKIHFLAMLTGFIEPHELIGNLIRLARNKAVYYTADLYDIYRKPVSIKSCFEEVSSRVVKFENSINNFSVEVILHNLPTNDLGICSISESTIFLTLSTGVFEINLKAKKEKCLLPIPDCNKNILALNGRIYVVRKKAVATVENGKFEIIAGAYPNLRLFEGPEKAPWALVNGYDSHERSPSPSQLIRLGKSLGQEEIYQIELPENARPEDAYICAAAYINSQNYLLVGNFDIAVFNLEGTVLKRVKTIVENINMMPNLTSLVRVSDNTFLAAHDYGGFLRIVKIDTDTGNLINLADLDVGGGVFALAPIDESSAYLFCRDKNGISRLNGMVLKIEY